MWSATVRGTRITRNYSRPLSYGPGHAHRDLPFLRGPANFGERFQHQLFELLVDLSFVPPELLDVLHPFEVRNGHAARVAEDIGNDEDVAAAKDLVRLRRGRPIRAFGENLTLNLGGVFAGDLAFESGGNQDRTGKRQQFLAANE